MKGVIILLVVLAVVLVGAIFSVFYVVNQEEESNQDNTNLDDITPDEIQQQDQLPDASQDGLPPTSESQGDELPKQISISTQEELFEEIRNAINKHLNE